MAFTKISTTLTDCFLIEPQVFGDARGFFMETYSESLFADIGLTNHWVQDNHSKSKKGVLRGLHFQTRKPQAKLVRVTSGSVYDVVVDLRKGSPTFGQWEGFLLSSENKRMLYVPRGFAHGFLTLEEGTEFLYKCDDVYDSEYEGGIIWNDPTLGIDWEKFGITDFEISAKDQKNTTFAELRETEIFVKNYQKKWNEWMRLKKNLHETKKPPHIKEGQIWWCHMGENIGTEVNGKGDSFFRPMIVYKKLSAYQFLGIPTTTQDKKGTWYCDFTHRNISMSACLHQIRVVDTKRLDNDIGQLNDTDFQQIKIGLSKLYL